MYQLNRGLLIPRSSSVTEAQLPVRQGSAKYSVVLLFPAKTNGSLWLKDQYSAFRALGSCSNEPLAQGNESWRQQDRQEDAMDRWGNSSGNTVA